MRTAGLRSLFLALALPLHADDLKLLESHVMLPGYCYAGSRADKEAFGGYGVSKNLPRKLGDRQLGTTDRIALVAALSEMVPFGGSHRGFRLFLVNSTKSEAAFAASDSRLAIVQEALDNHGSWRPIEYLPSSWCGNSHHRVFLPARHYWEFSAPQYGGSYKAKLRFVLQGEQPIYSNEFEGSINPQQFTEKKKHQSAGLMDPYSD